MNNYYKVAIGFFLGGFLVCFLVFNFTTPKQLPKVETVEVEKYIIKESQITIDSLVKVGIIRDKIIDSLKNKKHEKVTTYKPLERVIINDSIRTKNVSRFLK